MYKNISILGSTGSIGQQTLQVCSDLGINVHALAAGYNVKLLAEQIYKFQPKMVSVANAEVANELKSALIKNINIDIFYGDEGNCKVAEIPEAECVVSTIVGIAGLKPTMAAIGANKDIALANKETLVTAGKIIIDEIKKRKLKLIPIDSEHSAIFQCLMGNDYNEVSKVILTASGGPFRGLKKEQLLSITPDQALRHPNWEMGRKISIDSATLMNKGLEVVEAKWLFGLNKSQIDVIVHPQSIVHSMVEYRDSSCIAQIGLPDMRLPIQFALCYPGRIDGGLEKLDLTKIAQLTFEKPDLDTFKCLKIAFEILDKNDSLSNVMNAANEIAVDLFLSNSISFLQISDLIEDAVNTFSASDSKTIDEVLELDKNVREWAVRKYLNR